MWHDRHGSTLALFHGFFLLEFAVGEAFVWDTLSPFQREESGGPWLLKLLLGNSACHFCLHSLAKSRSLAKPDISATRRYIPFPGIGGDI